MKNFVILCVLFAMLPFNAVGMEQLSAKIGSGCRIGGCSSQLCADNPNNSTESGGYANEPLISTCEWTEKYGCYKSVGICEKQANGKCGWTQTPALAECFTKSQNKELKPAVLLKTE